MTALLWLLAAGLAGATFLPYAGGFYFLFELLSHFRIIYLGFGLTLTLLAWIQKCRAIAAVCLSCTLINGAEILPAYIPVASGVKGGDQLTIVQANVWSGNSSADRLLRLVDKIKPDIVALQEISPAWAIQLSALKDRYRYAKIVAREDNFGLALFSRLPVSRIKVHHYSLVPSISAQINWHGQSFWFIDAHVLPPLGADVFHNRNADMTKLFAEAKRHAPAIIAGDFNITRFSPVLKSLLAGANLSLASDGHGQIPSWPVAMIPPLIGIDHIFISPEFIATDVHTGPRLGSDHLPVITTLTWNSHQKNPGIHKDAEKSHP